MPIDVLMPALSPTMEEGKLAKWLVKRGDTVSSGDVIAEIETDKATMEVEAVDEGTVEAILVPEGTEGVKVNTPIARLDGGGDAPAKPAPVEKAAAETPRAEEPVPDKAKTAEPDNAPQPAAAAPAAPPAKPTPTAKPEGERIFASPLARRLAADAGLDLSKLEGSGPHGRIIARDIEAAGPIAKAAPKAAEAAKPAPVPADAAAYLEQRGVPPGSYDLAPLDGMRRTIARRMADSFRDVPHFPLNIDLEIDRLLAARAALNAMLEKDGVKISVNDIVIKAAAAALKRVPEANASYTPEGLALHHHADVAIAVALEHGLITPIIRAAETKGLAQIAAESKDLAERARTKRLKPDEYVGGTFTVSNLGMFGIKSFASIINQPQGAIMSVGAGEKRPVVRGDVLAVATVMTVTLTCDHRVVDGAIGARFLAAFKAMMEEPLGHAGLKAMAGFYDFKVDSLTGEPASMSDYAGAVVLAVNTASRCGFTKQYAGLEALWRKRRDQGLVVLGFPCNQFGEQEPGDAAEIASFCSLTYDVSFPMFAKIDVNGQNAHPLYDWLTRQKRGVLGTRAIKWNFTKFLIDRGGAVVARFGPDKTPEALEPAIEALL